MIDYNTSTIYTAKDFKDASYCFILPIGNAYPNKKENALYTDLVKEVEIESVGRDVIKAVNFSGKISISGSLDRHNSGWIPFPSMQEVHRHYHKHQMASVFRQIRWDDLSFNKLFKISNILQEKE